MEEINEKELDVLIKFMHPRGPARSFHWPNREDCCWVPQTHVICKIEVPTTATGRQYYLAKQDIMTIPNKFIALN